MCSNKMSEKGEKTEPPKPSESTKDAAKSRSTGWGRMQSTSAFRAINFELYVKPNKFVMVLGASLFLGSIGCMVYWNLTASSRKKTYVTIDEDGGMTSRPRTSKWD